MRRLLLVTVAAIFGTTLLFQAPVWAKYTGPSGQTPTAGAVEQGRSSVETGQTRVLGEHFTRASNGGFLAFSGADIAGLVGIALLSIAVGTVLVRVRGGRKPQLA
jgi:hypothetical protein